MEIEKPIGILLNFKIDISKATEFLQKLFIFDKIRTTAKFLMEIEKSNDILWNFKIKI